MMVLHKLSLMETQLHQVYRIYKVPMNTFQTFLDLYSDTSEVFLNIQLCIKLCKSKHGQLHSEKIIVININKNDYLLYYEKKSSYTLTS